MRFEAHHYATEALRLIGKAINNLDEAGTKEDLELRDELGQQYWLFIGVFEIMHELRALDSIDGLVEEVEQGNITLREAKETAATFQLQHAEIP